MCQWLVSENGHNAQIFGNIFNNCRHTDIYRQDIANEFAKCEFSVHHENMPIYFYPLKPHFYMVKLRFTGVYIIFLFLLKNINCGYCAHNLCFEKNYEKYQNFLSENFHFFFFFFFFGGKIFNIFE